MILQQAYAVSSLIHERSAWDNIFCVTLQEKVRRNEQEKQDPQALMHGADKHFKNNLREAESDLIKR